MSLNSNLSFQVSSISLRPLCLPAGHCDFASFGHCVNVQSVPSCLLLVPSLDVPSQLHLGEVTFANRLEEPIVADVGLLISRGG